MYPPVEMHCYPRDFSVHSLHATCFGGHRMASGYFYCRTIFCILRGNMIDCKYDTTLDTVC